MLNFHVLLNLKLFIGKAGEPPKMKDEKELKPVSMRVRDAAESLLMLILDQVKKHDFF